MGTFRRSVGLVKSSWLVLREDKELMWLPVISGIATLLTAAPFLLGAAGLFVADGGTSSVTSSVVRAAVRNSYRPIDDSYGVGFRPSRTYP